MNEKDYQYTLTVATCKSFSRAAELLYISQPALSRYISTLEKELGATLFDRSTSPIQLTSAGIRFCSYANAILELESAMLHDLKENALLSGKPIKVGVPFLTGEYMLSRVLPPCHEEISSCTNRPGSGYLKQSLPAAGCASN